MNISQLTISILSKIICGDPIKGNLKTSPYKTLTELKQFFMAFHGIEDDNGLSRLKYCSRELNKFNNSNSMHKIINESVHTIYYKNTEFDNQKVVNYLNLYLSKDDFILEKSSHSGNFEIKIENNSIITNNLEKFNLPNPKNILTHQFIKERIDKAKEKIKMHDYDGAITNARSLSQAILEEIIKRYNIELKADKGDLKILWSLIKQNLNLHIKPEINNSFKSILSGLIG